MDGVTFHNGLILVRHGLVDPRYEGICYGCSDVELGLDGYEQHRQLVEAFRALTIPIRRIHHSGLQRTRLLAESLGEVCDVKPLSSDLLRERDYGQWELRSWDWIYRTYGDEMMRMIVEPQHYHPGGGETTFEMRDRVMEWHRHLPRDGLTIAVTHGGPIAALSGTLKKLPVDAWPSLIPPCGETVFLEGREQRTVSSEQGIEQ